MLSGYWRLWAFRVLGTRFYFTNKLIMEKERHLRSNSIWVKDVAQYNKLIIKIPKWHVNHCITTPCCGQTPWLKSNHSSWLTYAHLSQVNSNFLFRLLSFSKLSLFCLALRGLLLPLNARRQPRLPEKFVEHLLLNLFCTTHSYMQRVGTLDGRGHTHLKTPTLFESVTAECD